MSTSKRHELDDLFHQPARLEIMAELCSSAEGRTFLELRERCNLTDGNLSRHLQFLAQAGAVKIKKAFVKMKPVTTASATAKGREGFLRYLEALEEVLHDAAQRAKGGAKDGCVTRGALKPVRG
jgi:hypothetical protein